MERQQVIQQLADLLEELELAEQQYLECYQKLERIKYQIREKESHLITTNPEIRNGKNREVRRALLDEGLGVSLIKEMMECKRGLEVARSKRNQLIRRYEAALLSARIALSPSLNFDIFNKIFP